MPALFRLRRSYFGKCLLQKFSGDVVKGPPPGFRDVPWNTEIELLGGFTIIPRDDYDRMTARIGDADRRAKLQRDSRAKRSADPVKRAKAQRDFVATRMPGDDEQ